MDVAQSQLHPLPPSPFTICVLQDGSETAITLAGELDLATVDELEHTARALRRAGSTRIVVDLRRLDFLDSTGLGSLMTLRNDAKRAGHSLKLVPGPRDVQRIFDLSGTRGLFDWRDY